MMIIKENKAHAVKSKFKFDISQPFNFLVNAQSTFLNLSPYNYFT